MGTSFLILVAFAFGFGDALIQTCYFNNHTYNHLSVWTDQCKIHTCINGSTTTKINATCCPFQGGHPIYPHGATIYLNCFVWTCNNGQWYDTINQTCCHPPNETSLEPMKNRERRDTTCYMYNCKDGRLTTQVKEHCCRWPGRDITPHGKNFTDQCNVRTCDDGNWILEILPSCCYINKTKEHVMHGDKRYSGCDVFTCENGTLLHEPNKTCCQWKNKSDFIPHGGKRHSGCDTFTCKKGTLLQAKNNTCCQWKNESKLILHGDKRYSGCDIFTCKKGTWLQNKNNACCQWKNESKLIPHGDARGSTCNTHTCVNGTMTPGINTTCCKFGSKYVPHGFLHHFHKCHKFFCNYGIGHDIKDPGCCKWSPLGASHVEWYRSGEWKYYACYAHQCSNAKWTRYQDRLPDC